MKKGPHKMMLESSRYDKWDRGSGGGAGGGSSGPWPARDRDRDRERERERERERQARAHQMSHAHAPEPDASSLFPAPVRVVGNRDRLSQQIQNKLGDYHLAQPLLDDPSKSIGICPEPPSPAPCPPSRRESEFKKPAHAPQNGRVHHRPYMYNKGDIPGSTASAHRPPNIRIPNGGPPQNAIDSSQPKIESILKEMKALPTKLSVIAATPRKEQENKFVFNPYLNRLVQDNSQHNDLKTPLTKPGLDNRISNSRSSASPVDLPNKDLGLSESDDEVAATTTQLEPIISPIGSGGSPSSGSESSPSDSESESSSAESSNPPAPVASPPGSQPSPERSSWYLSNFAPPPAQPTDFESKELRQVLADVKGKPSLLSDLSDSSASSPSPACRRRAHAAANRSSAVSSDDDTPRHNTQSPRQPSAPATPLKRGRPPKKTSSSTEPPKKRRGRPPRKKSESTTGAAASPRDSEAEPEPAPVQTREESQVKSHIFRKVFTAKKGDEGGGKGKGGKGKGGKGKGQVTIIEVTAPESGADDDERRHRDRSAERRNEEAIARVSPPPEPEIPRRREDRISHDRIQERSIERTDHRRADDRPDRTTERTSNDRISERIPTERTSNDRIPSNERSRGAGYDRLSTNLSDRRQTDRLSSDRMVSDRLCTESMTERLTDRHTSGRLSSERLSSEKITHEKLTHEKMSHEDVIKPIKREKMVERTLPDRYVRAEADVGSGIKSERGSERFEEASSNVRCRSRCVVRVPWSRLPPATALALRAPRPPVKPKLPPTPPTHQGASVPATNHERVAGRVYYSYFEQLPADAMFDEKITHESYLEEAKRLRSAADREQEPLARVMLYLESVLCFVLTGRVLETEKHTKRAFTIYRETIEYIKSIHSMPSRYRASPHSTFSKLDILSLRVQALLYLRMFKMYNSEVKEYYKIVQEYQSKPAGPESVSPLSPTPSPAGSVGSVGSAASASSGYCSLAHSVPAPAHHALLQLTKYYTFLYVAHDLWEQADILCRMPANQDLFIAVDRKCGPLTLFSSFHHLVQYVRHAISLLKTAPRE